MKKKILVAVSIIFTLIIIVSIVMIIKNKNTENDSQTYNNMRFIRWDLDTDDIKNNVSELSLKKGDKINISIKVADINDNVLNEPYIQNMEIKNFLDINYKETTSFNKTKYLELALPSGFYSLTSTIVKYPTVTLTIDKSKNQRANLYVNEKIYDILDNKYRVKDESSK